MHPVYIAGCGDDRIIDRFNQLLQFSFYDDELKTDEMRKIGAHAKRVQTCHRNPIFAHVYLDTTPYDSLQFILQNIDGSGITKAESNKLKTIATIERVKHMGILTKFDQDEIILDALNEEYDGERIFDQEDMEYL